LGFVIFKERLAKGPSCSPERPLFLKRTHFISGIYRAIIDHDMKELARIVEFLKGKGIDLEFAQPSGAGDALQRA
jgi:hypothetical protein